jgi:hypothetical protein
MTQIKIKIAVKPMDGYLPSGLLRESIQIELARIQALESGRRTTQDHNGTIIALEAGADGFLGIALRGSAAADVRHR